MKHELSLTKIYAEKKNSRHEYKIVSINEDSLKVILEDVETGTRMTTSIGSFPRFFREA